MLGAVLVVASCASHQPFPADWTPPATEAGDGCPDISGAFRNEGETFDGKPAQRLMFRWFAPRDDFPVPVERWQDVRKVAIFQQGPEVRITASSEGETFFTKVLRGTAGEFVCQDGWLSVNASNASGGSGAVMVSTETRSFARAGGYLVERRGLSGFGLILVVPIGGSGTYWARYPEWRE